MLLLGNPSRKHLFIPPFSAYCLMARIFHKLYLLSSKSRNIIVSPLQNLPLGTKSKSNPKGDLAMTTPNDHVLTDTQTETIIGSLDNEIASLKSQLKRKDHRIASLDAMFNQLIESHN